MNTILSNIDDIKRVKEDIKVAIEEKGVDMTNTPFTGYAAKINEIPIDSGDYETGFEDGVASQKAKLTNITIINNGTYTSEDGYGEVVVNVESKMPLVNGTKLRGSTFTEIPSFYDFSNITDYSYMFYDCSKIQTVPELDTSNIKDMRYMFGNCFNLQSIPLLDTSNVTNMSGLFYDCESLTTIPQLDTSNVTNMSSMFTGCNGFTTIPYLNTSNVTNMSNMFYECQKLQTISLIDTSKVVNMYNMFHYCTQLQTIPQLDTSNVTHMGWMFHECYNLTTLPALDVDKVTYIDNYFGFAGNNLTDVGGWINLKCNWIDNYGLARCSNLTYQSCINVLNGLADVTELGGRTLKVHQNFLTTVGDEISIGTNKGWIISAS